MADETTPLSEKLNLTESTKQKVKEISSQAETVIKGSIHDFVETAKNGNTSIRGLAMIAGLALIVSGIVEILVNLLHFQLTFALIAFYSLLMGFMAVAMEVDSEALPYGATVRAWIMKHVGLVQLSSGRGVFYLIAGTLALTQDEYSAKIVGLYTVIVAIAYIIIGRRAVSKIKVIRAAKYPNFLLKKKFKRFDGNGDGNLSFEEFRDLLKSLEVDITYQGAEMLFVSLDRDFNGDLSFEEFQRVWTDEELTLVPV